MDPRRAALSLALFPVAPLVRAAGEVMAGLRMLSQIAEHTAGMLVATRVLPDINRTMDRVAADTTALPALAESIERVAQATEALALVEERMASIEAAMPVLVEVQQHLSVTPQILEHLDDRMERTGQLIEQLLVSLEQLTGHVDALGTAVGPLGRLARRVPSRRRGERVAAESQAAESQAGA